jgi:AraC-like DNA-binding protein
MPKNEESYFSYFATSPDMEVWGLTVTAAGYTRVTPGMAYPPASHPDDHSLDWRRGRVLDALQLVLVIGGRGQFETESAGLREIGAGAAFALLPGVWHRYRPDPATGWRESWVEVRGPLVERLLAKGFFPEKAPVRPGALGAGMEAALAQVHAYSRKGPPGFDCSRAAAACAVLAAWDRAGIENAEPPTRLARAVEEAERFLAEHHAEPVDVHELAKQLGVAYSHFRKAFRDHTGFAPWQYVLHLRLARARRLLASTDMTLDEMAGRLGFSSGFHLSTMFKRAHGVSPQVWKSGDRPDVEQLNKSR